MKFMLNYSSETSGNLKSVFVHIAVRFQDQDSLGRHISIHTLLQYHLQCAHVRSTLMNQTFSATETRYASSLHCSFGFSKTSLLLAHYDHHCPFEPRLSHSAGVSLVYRLSL